MQTADLVFKWWFDWGIFSMLLLGLGLIAWSVSGLQGMLTLME
jgi:hypothetical protein